MPQRSPEQLQATRRRLEGLTNDARTLIRRSKLAAGTAKLYELLTLTPHDAPALTELAWAEFRMGRLRSAWSHALRALAETEVEAKTEAERAQLHYYLGRIAALRKQPELAARCYQRALALRPDSPAATHLERLRLAPEHLPLAPRVPTSPALGGLPVLAEALPDGESMCRVLARSSLCAPESCAFANTLAGTDASWDMLVIEDQYGLGRCYHPAIQTEAGWTLFAAALHESKGEEIERAVDQLRARAEAGPGGPHLVFEWAEHRHARDWSRALGQPEHASALPVDVVEDREGVIVCQRVDARARCSTAIMLAGTGWHDAQPLRYRASFELGAVGIQLNTSAHEGPLGAAYRTTNTYAWAPLEHPRPDGVR